MFRKISNPVVFILIAAFIMLTGASSCQPKINKQPADLTVACGNTATFSVMASGSSLAYQWEFSEDGSTWSAIPGTNASSCALRDVRPSDDGSMFRCVVSNTYGKAVSNAATLTVFLYTVTYDGNGNTVGSVPNDITGYEQGQPVIVLGNMGDLAKDGNVFAGWNTQADGKGIAYSTGNTFNMGTSNVTLYANWSKIYAIRDKGPSGVGIVFYITDGGIHGLEAAPSQWNGGSEDPRSEWSNVISKLELTSTAIGTGLANSNAIIAQAGHTASAAKLCRDYRGGGLTDWFLPSKDELNELYRHKTVVDGFADSNYWSSSEYDAYNAWIRIFNINGQDHVYFKGNGCNVRAIRAF